MIVKDNLDYIELDSGEKLEIIETIQFGQTKYYLVPDEDDYQIYKNIRNRLENITMRELDIRRKAHF